MKERGPEVRRAVRVAERAIAALRKVPEFADKALGSIRGFSGGGERALFEVALNDRTGAQGGHLIVSASRQLPPVLGMSATMPGPVTLLAPHIQHERDVIEWMSPTCSVLLSRGKKVSRVHGVLPGLPHERPPELRRGVIASEWLRIRREAIIATRVDAIAAAWATFDGVSASASDDVIRYQPLGDYHVTHVEGYDWQPQFSQTPPQHGANPYHHWIGCGPVAWATLFAWHDLTWTPDLLRGSQASNGAAWGGDPEDSTYVDRLLKALHDDLGTHAPNWAEQLFGGAETATGFTRDADMSEGFAFLSDELGHDLYGPVLMDDCTLQELYDYLSIHNRPAIIKIPDHSCVASGFLFDVSGDAHFIIVNTGWGYTGYIPALFFEELAWAFHHLEPVTKRKYALTSTFAPCVLASKEDTRIYLRENDGRIAYLRSANPAANPSPASKRYTGLTSRLGTRVVNDGRRIAVTINAAGFVKLWDEQPAGWVALPFPNVQSEVTPGLALVGDQLVVFVQNSDWGLQVFGSRAYRNHWVSAGATADDIAYWRPMGLTFASDTITAFSYYGRVMALWRDRYHHALFGYIDGEQANGALPASAKYFVEPVSGSEHLYSPHLFRSYGGYYVSVRTEANRIQVRDVAMTIPGGLGAIIGGAAGPLTVVLGGVRAYLLETARYETSIETAVTGGGPNESPTPWMWTAWIGTDAARSLRLWRLSIDRTAAEMGYQGFGF